MHKSRSNRVRIYFIYIGKSLQNGYGLKRIPQKYNFTFTSETDVCSDS